MVGNTNLFVITKIWWERIFLHIEILASRQDAVSYTHLDVYKRQ